MNEINSLSFCAGWPVSLAPVRVNINVSPSAFLNSIARKLLLSPGIITPLTTSFKVAPGYFCCISRCISWRIKLK